MTTAPQVELTLLRELATGTFARLYLARARREGSLERTVAVKILREQWNTSPDLLARTGDEARLLARLRHRHIVRVEDTTTIDGQFAILMEYVEGLDLKQLVETTHGADRRVPARVAVHIACAVASALEAAHHRVPHGLDRPLRVVHRDIKPSNIMVGGDGEVKVLDFGTARYAEEARAAQTREMRFGSLKYMSPERRDGDRGDLPGDIYALGLVLLETLRGAWLPVLPLDPQEHDEAIAAYVNELPPDLMPDDAWDQGFRQLLCRLCAADPAWRPDIRDAVRLLRAYVDQGLGASMEAFAAEVVRPAVAAQLATPATGELAGRVLHVGTRALENDPRLSVDAGRGRGAAPQVDGPSSPFPRSGAAAFGVPKPMRTPPSAPEPRNGAGRDGVVAGALTDAEGAGEPAPPRQGAAAPPGDPDAQDTAGDPHDDEPIGDPFERSPRAGHDPETPAAPAGPDRPDPEATPVQEVVVPASATRPPPDPARLTMDPRGIRVDLSAETLPEPAEEPDRISGPRPVPGGDGVRPPFPPFPPLPSTRALRPERSGRMPTPEIPPEADPAVWTRAFAVPLPGPTSVAAPRAGEPPPPPTGEAPVPRKAVVKLTSDGAAAARKAADDAALDAAIAAVVGSVRSAPTVELPLRSAPTVELPRTPSSAASSAPTTELPRPGVAPAPAATPTPAPVWEDPDPETDDQAPPPSRGLAVMAAGLGGLLVLGIVALVAMIVVVLWLGSRGSAPAASAPGADAPAPTAPEGAATAPEGAATGEPAGGATEPPGRTEPAIGAGAPPGATPGTADAAASPTAVASGAPSDDAATRKVSVAAVGDGLQWVMLGRAGESIARGQDHVEANVAPGAYRVTVKSVGRPAVGADVAVTDADVRLLCSAGADQAMTCTGGARLLRLVP